ncbi:DUF58 domain-containing protein [bacterium]|nr:DUF58 domain-containing protein [bacterium]
MKLDSFFYKSYKYFYFSEQKRWKKWTINGVFFSLFTLLSFLLGFDPTRSITMMFFTLSFITLIILIVSTKIMRGEFKIVRKLPKESYIGTPVNYKIIIENQSKYTHNGLIFLDEEFIEFPTFDEFIKYPEPNEDKRNRWDRRVKYYRWIWMLNYKKRAELKEFFIPPIKKFSKIETIVQLIPKNRGELFLNKSNVIFPDMFGIFRSFIEINTENSLYILPKTYNITGFKLTAGISANFMGELTTPEIGDGDEFHSLREYKYGDSWRNIDWKSWGKTGKPIVKEYQKTGKSRNMIIIDNYDDGFGEKFEEAISLGYSFWNSNKFLFSKILIGENTLQKLQEKIVETKFFSLAKLDRVDNFEKNIKIWTKESTGFSTIIYITSYLDSKRELEINKIISKGVFIQVFQIVSEKTITKHHRLIKYLQVGNIENDLQ